MEMQESILYQDNTNSIQLVKNAKASIGQRTRHINIRYFLIKDKIESGEVTILFCPIDNIIADFFTNSLQGNKFISFRDSIMGVIKVAAVAKE